jgi:hypothetical protein
LRATTAEVKTDGRKESPYCYGYDRNSRAPKGFTYPFSKHDFKLWNRTTITRTLEQSALDLRNTSLDLKKGLYSVPIEYLINIDGSLTLYSIGKMEFFSKGELIQDIQGSCHLSRFNRHIDYERSGLERKYLDNEEQIKISTWIEDRISKIHDYPVPVVGKEGGLQLKTRYFGRDTFIFYID